MALRIQNIFAYEVLDSRGFPTIACIAKISSGLFGKQYFSAKAMVPSGASTGEREALELRDGDKSRFLGKGLKKAVHYVNYVIAASLVENKVNPENQEELDQFLIDLDGTEDKSRYGANAILSVSLAVAKAVAKAKKLPFYQYIAKLTGNAYPSKFILPLPMVNVINGGAHADNTIDFQEFMFMPIGASSMHEAVRISSECFHSLQKCLKEKGLNTNKGDEGGFAPNLRSIDEVLMIMLTAIEKAGYKPGIIGGQVALALDVAASELYDKEKKVYVFEKLVNASILTPEQATKTTDQMIEYYKDLVEKYPIISIEDPLDESDWNGFAKLNAEIGDKIQIVGDDLFCTNPKITREGISKRVANSVLVKMNQIGTISETLKTIQAAKEAGWTCILSHRSGETEDTSIADIAVGTSAGQIKTGSMSRSERIAKYNRLLEIEIELTAAHSSFYGIYSIFSLDFNNSALFKTKNYILDWAKGKVKVEIVDVEDSKASDSSEKPSDKEEKADKSAKTDESGKPDSANEFDEILDFETDEPNASNKDEDLVSKAGAKKSKKEKK